MRVYKNEEEELTPNTLQEGDISEEDIKEESKKDILQEMSDAIDSYTDVLNRFLKECINKGRFYSFSVGLKMLKRFKTTNADVFDSLIKDAKDN